MLEITQNPPHVPLKKARFDRDNDGSSNGVLLRFVLIEIARSGGKGENCLRRFGDSSFG